MYMHVRVCVCVLWGVCVYLYNTSVCVCVWDYASIIAGHRCSQTPTVIRNDSRAVAKGQQDDRWRSAASDDGRRCRRRRQ